MAIQIEYVNPSEDRLNVRSHTGLDDSSLYARIRDREVTRDWVNVYTMPNGSYIATWESIGLFTAIGHRPKRGRDMLDIITEVSDWFDYLAKRKKEFNTNEPKRSE